MAKVVSLAVVALVGVGCGAPEAMGLRNWTLTDAAGAPLREVTLPCHVDGDIPPGVPEFGLRAHVELPTSLRDRPLSLAVPYFAALVSLRVNGRETSSNRARTTNVYRADAHQWTIPGELTRERTLDLELRVENRWTQSTWVDTVPRLSAESSGDRGFALVHGVNVAAGAAAMVTAILIALLYGVVWLLERREVAYGWFAAASLGAAPFAQYPAGFLQPLVGRYEVACGAIGMAAAAVAAAHHARARLGLPRPHVAWWGAVASLVVLAFVRGDGFSATRWLVPAAIFLCLTTAAHHLTLATRARRVLRSRTRTLGATIGWPVAVAVCIPDVLAWLGRGETLGGLRTGPLAVLAVLVAQGIVLGLDHVVSIRRAHALNQELTLRVASLEETKREIETLNAELHRQLLNHSDHMADLVSRMGEGEARELERDVVVGKRYRIIRTLGAGGSARVYEVVRTSDARPFALKTLHHADNRVTLTRFAEEARLAAPIRHPNVVSVVDVDIDARGFLYIVTDLVDGPGLNQLRGRFGDVPWALPILRQVALGLGAIHAHGVVHRDLKPGNVLVARDATGGPLARIGDFGIAKVADDRETTARQVRGTGIVAGTRKAAPSLTETGFVVGTPMYMAPETLHGDGRALPAADVFSFGVMAFEMCAGKRLFGSTPPGIALLGDEAGRPVVFDAPGVRPDLGKLLSRCLEVEPARRPTAQDLARILGRSS